MGLHRTAFSPLRCAKAAVYAGVRCKCEIPGRTTLDELSSNFRVEFCSQGPTEKGWSGHYLECPICKDLLEKGGCHCCTCGNISIDDGMLRVTVENGDKKAVKTYYAYKK